MQTRKTIFGAAPVHHVIRKNSSLGEVTEEGHSDGEGNESEVPNSLWWHIYEGISQYSKFENLLVVIKEMHKVLAFHSDAVRKKEIAKFLMKLSKHRKQEGKELRARFGTQETITGTGSGG